MPEALHADRHCRPSEQSQSLQDVWRRLRQKLCSAGFSNADLEAEVLLRHALSMERGEFFASLSEPVAPEQIEQAEGLAERRVGGEPLSYITGHREFYGLEILVDERVLIPRQETELLVDLASGACADREGERVVIADVCTGSGAIAVALASRIPHSFVYATDVSAGALEVAGVNVERQGVAERVRLLRGDLLAPLPERADVIVSNPPYIPKEDLPRLPEDVRREPALALDGGLGGTSVIARLLEQAQTALKPGGSLFVEISPEQRDVVMGMAERCLSGAEVDVVRDAGGLYRVLCVRQGQGYVGQVAFM